MCETLRFSLVCFQEKKKSSTISSVRLDRNSPFQQRVTFDVPPSEFRWIQRFLTTCSVAWVEVGEGSMWRSRTSTTFYQMGGPSERSAPLPGVLLVENSPCHPPYQPGKAALPSFQVSLLSVVGSWRETLSLPSKEDLTGRSELPICDF